MSVRFVIGRAGAGKTRHCLAALQQALIRDPTAGPRLVLLVPEQASLQMERALLSGPVRATARAEVLSFRRLALRILQTAGRAPRDALSPAARAMVLRRIVGRISARLRYYRRVDRLAGFFEHIGRAIAELIEENVSPADLRASGAVTEDETGRGDKLADIAAIYAEYLDYLGVTRLDPSQYLQLAREALPRCPTYQNARFWIDGFAGFTGQELALLADLGRRGCDMDVTLLIDPDEFTGIDASAGVDPTSLFARPLRTCLRLRQLLADTGCAIDEPLLLRPAKPPRFLASADLARLESGMVRPALAGDSAAPASSDVAVAVLPDRRAEVAYAVAQVCALVQRSADPLRYRDVAIICRDLTAYHDLLSAALEERGVPYFIDRRRGLAHHPLVEFIRCVADIGATRAALEPLRLLIKTDLLTLDAAAADALENYILAHGITGPEAWATDWAFPVQPSRSRSDPRDAERLRAINAARLRVVGVLGELLFPPEAPRTGRTWASALRALCARADVSATVAKWCTRAEDDGEVERAAEHRQALDAVTAFLDDLANALPEEPLDAGELVDIIEAGLAELTLGLIPPTVDQVLVGSIERSRHPDIKVAIVLGFNDGIFPSRASEDVVLNDEDREVLAKSDVRVGVTRKQRLLDERLLAYIAVTRPSHRLLITSAAADECGKPLRPSPFLGDLQRALPGTGIRRIEDPARAGALWPIWSPGDLASAITLEFSRRVADAPVDDDRRRLWNDLYAISRVSDRARPALARAVGSLAFRNEALLKPASVDALISAPYTASVSELEAYASCPFQRFCRYGLRLETRREADLRPTDVGTVHHAILEAYLNECLASGERFTDVSEADVLPRLERCAGRIAADLEQQGEISSARDAYLVARSARDLSHVVSSQRRVAARGSFVPRAAEKSYGVDGPESLEALEIDTPQGRRVRIRGVIDRVDLAEVGDELVGVVVDYKRTRDKRLDLARVWHGLSLQLLGYLLALAERGHTLAGRKIIPVGAFYVSLLRKYKSVDHPEDCGELAAPEEFIPRGVFDESRMQLLETDAPAQGWARLYKIYRKSDGSLGHIGSSDAADSAEFQALLAHTRARLGALADGVLDGDVSVSPYRLKNFSPCAWCDMRSVCRFEFGDSGMRQLEALPRSEVLKRVSEEA